MITSEHIAFHPVFMRLFSLSIDKLIVPLPIRSRLFTHQRSKDDTTSIL